MRAVCHIPSEIVIVIHKSAWLVFESQLRFCVGPVCKIERLFICPSYIASSLKPNKTHNTIKININEFNKNLDRYFVIFEITVTNQKSVFWRKFRSYRKFCTILIFWLSESPDWSVSFQKHWKLASFLRISFRYIVFLLYFFSEHIKRICLTYLLLKSEKYLLKTKSSLI